MFCTGSPWIGQFPEVLLSIYWKYFSMRDSILFKFFPQERIWKHSTMLWIWDILCILECNTSTREIHSYKRNRSKVWECLQHKANHKQDGLCRKWRLILPACISLWNEQGIMIGQKKLTKKIIIECCMKRLQENTTRWHHYFQKLPSFLISYKLKVWASWRR